MGHDTSPSQDSLELLSPSQPPSTSDAKSSEGNNHNRSIKNDEDTVHDMATATSQPPTPSTKPALESQPYPDNVPVLAAELAPNQEAVTERVTQQLQEQIASQWQQRIQQVVQDRLNVENHQDNIGEGEKKEVIQVVAVPLGEEEKCKDTSSNAANARDRSPFRRLCIVGSCVLLVMAAIIAGVLVATNNNGNSGETQAPTGDPGSFSGDDMTFSPSSSLAPTEPNPRWIYLVETLEPLLSGNVNDNATTRSWLELIQDPSSPQGKALRWMAKDDDFSNPPDHLETTVLLERYIAAVLYYSGNNGSKEDWPFNYLDPVLSVCRWNLGFNILQTSAQGLFCTDFEHHGSITYVLLQELGLTGTIPSELGLLEHLLGVHLHTNAFTGVLPMTNLPLSLIDLELANNRISGTLPSTWATTLPNLETIWVENNRLSGTIPSEWQAMVKIEWLDLGSNGITGAIPTILSVMTNLEYLYLEYNDLSGTLPSEIGSLSLLKNLLVQGNIRLEGTVPSEYASLSGLDQFWMEDTSLTGSLNGMFCNASFTMSRPTLKADCLGDVPEMECSCCDYCCTSDGLDCELL